MSTAIENGLGPSGGDIAGAERVQQEVLTGKIPGLRNHAKSWGSRDLLAALGGVSALLSVACGSGAPNSEPAGVIPIATTAPEPPPVPTAISTPEPAATATAQAGGKIPPEGTQIPKEKTPEDSCSFMGIKCSKADLLKKNIDGIDYYYVGLNFPEDTEIPFPIDGQLSFTELSPDAPFRGASVTITNTDRSLRLPVFSFYGSLEKTATPLGVNLPKGTLAVKTSGKEERKNYGYDVVFLASRQNAVTKKPESLLDVYKAAIPNLSDKSIEVRSQGTGKIVNDLFLNGTS